jgi:hypothetical protein
MVADPEPVPAAAPPDADAAEAAAEVAAMMGVNPANIGRQRAGAGGGGRQRDPTADEAVMGAAGEGVGGFEILDESGELVRARFLQFLME